MSEREEMLKKLGAYAFAAYDWNLYLDTHPDDKEAIAMFRKMADKANMLRNEFQTRFGPLTAKETMNEEEWIWIHNPWPWDNI